MTEPSDAQRTVDELEEKILGEQHDQHRDDDSSGETDESIEPQESTDHEPPV